MIGLRLGIGLLIATYAALPASAQFHLLGRTSKPVDQLNACLAGRVLDYTANHGCDHRIYSEALCSKRDLYVYLPPGYDGTTKFPLVLSLHGYSQDERKFLDLIPQFDAKVRCGELPPCILVAPDGTLSGKSSLLKKGSFYLNGASGRFEDYIVQDIWHWARKSFAVRPEREAHVILGGSMGGFAAYNLGFKYPDEFGVLIGLLPALDIRYADCRGNPSGPYDPSCFGYREDVRPLRPVGRLGVLTIRERQIANPLFGHDLANAISIMAANNPVEMLDACDIKPGQYQMFIGYGTKDELNVHSQCEHFLDVAKKRGICPEVVVVPGGRHRVATAEILFPNMCKWLNPRLAPYAPGGGK